MAKEINISVNPDINESIISNLSSKKEDLGKKIDNVVEDSDMCGRVVSNISDAFTKLDNIKSEIASLNDALVDFLSDANDGIIEADNSIAAWISNGIENK